MLQLEIYPRTHPVSTVPVQRQQHAYDALFGNQEDQPDQNRRVIPLSMLT